MGREVYLDIRDGLWQKDIVDGTHDNFVFDFIADADWGGRVIFDVGSHVGYHAMAFSQLVGDRGKVYAFEPNTYNRNRLLINLSRNEDLLGRVEVVDVAISSVSGDAEFCFSPLVDSGESSGSFVSGSDTPLDTNIYELLGFKRVPVKTTTFEDLLPLHGVTDEPALIKIDVEGAESAILDSNKSYLSRVKPDLLIELHNISNILKCYKTLYSLGYSVEIVKKETAERLFVYAKHCYDYSSLDNYGSIIDVFSEKFVNLGLDAVSDKDAEIAELKSEILDCRSEYDLLELKYKNIEFEHEKMMNEGFFSENKFINIFLCLLKSVRNFIRS